MVFFCIHYPLSRIYFIKSAIVHTSGMKIQYKPIFVNKKYHYEKLLGYELVFPRFLRLRSRQLNFVTIEMKSTYAWKWTIINFTEKVRFSLNIPAEFGIIHTAIVMAGMYWSPHPCMHEAGIRMP